MAQATSPSGTEQPAGAVGYVLGTPLQITSYTEWITRCHQLAKEHQTFVVDFTNTYILTMRRHDSQFRQLTSRVDFFIPDAMPLVWCLNRQGARMKDRVYGPTFLRQCVLASPAPLTHYFLGGSEDCLARLQSALHALNPNLRVVGAHHGYFRPDEEAAIIEDLNALSPDFIWIGLGTPKQQAWSYRHKSALRRGVIFLAGYAFDVNAGTKPDAPLWLQKAGLGWLFRLASEPRRLLGRYLKYNSLFLFYLLWDGLRGRAFAQD